MRQDPSQIAQELTKLAEMSAPALRALWRETFGRPHPSWVQKDFLVRALAYRVQEKVYGGLSPADRRQLRRHAEEVRSTGRIASLDALKIKPGTRLVRGWSGNTHVVTVIEGGFEYCGKRYGSLSEIARLITGTRWSGPLFFGLKTTKARPLR